MDSRSVSSGRFNWTDGQCPQVSRCGLSPLDLSQNQMDSRSITDGRKSRKVGLYIFNLWTEIDGQKLVDRRSVSSGRMDETGGQKPLDIKVGLLVYNSVSSGRMDGNRWSETFVLRSVSVVSRFVSSGRIRWSVSSERLGHKR